MKKILYISAGILLCSFILLPPKEVKLSKEKVLEQMTQSNDYLMKRWPDPGVNVITNKERPSNLWTRGTYYTGLMALYSIDPRDEYYEYAVNWGEAHEWHMRDGINRNANTHCAGQTYIELYNIDPKPERIAKIREAIDMMVDSEKKDDWWWIDALYMAMPTFTKLGLVEEDEKYFQKMYDLYLFTKESHGGDGLYNEADGLWWRDENFKPPYKTPGGKDCYWSRGNGWVFAALARVLDIIPEDAIGYEDYKATYLKMAEALVSKQRKDGFWNVSLDDPEDFGGKESSGTSFFVYGMAWGINNGLLPKEEYISAVNKGWEALIKEAVHPDGSIGYVQATGDRPSDGQPVTYDSKPDFEDYTIGAFLLAGSEVYHLAK
jgi:unsaturated rhamnogalacturonyl hydrolase